MFKSCFDVKDTLWYSIFKPLILLLIFSILGVSLVLMTLETSNQSLSSWSETKPKIVKRECGGWLAVAPPRAAFRMGVTAQSEDEAIEKFKISQARWAEILLSEPG